MKRPLPSEHPDYFKKYIDLVPGDNPIRVMEHQVLALQSMLSDLPEDKEDYAYEKGKWTLKEVIGHIIDTERIMAYRALVIARGEKKPLPGFEPDEYMQHSRFSKRSLYDLCHEFGHMRGSHIALFKSFDEEAMSRVGTANNWEMSVRSIIFTIAGHELHHVKMIREKYL